MQTNAAINIFASGNAERLAEAQMAIDDELFLRLSVLDIQDDDGTLVVLAKNTTAPMFLRQVLQKIWGGPVEVYVGTALMAGA